SGVDLGDDRLLDAATDLVQAKQVKAAGRAYRLRDVPGFHLADLVGDDRRKLRAAPPTERAALDVRAALRVGDRELREVLAGKRLVVDLACAPFACLDLLRRRGDRHRDEDVRDVVLGIAVGRGLLARHELLQL